MRRTFAGLLCALLVLAECAGASGPQTFEMRLPEHGYALECGGEPVPLTGQINMTVILLRADTEIWRHRIEDCAPGETVQFTTPGLDSGSYQLWVRGSRNGVSGCDTTVSFHVKPDSVAPPPDTVTVSPYAVRALYVDYAVVDTRNGLPVHPLDIAAKLNSLFNLTRPNP